MMPRSLVRRAQMAVRRTVTLADLMAQLAEVHGDAVMVTEELTAGRTRTLTYLEAARQVERWSVAVALAALRDVRW